MHWPIKHNYLSDPAAEGDFVHSRPQLNAADIFDHPVLPARTAVLERLEKELNKQAVDLDVVTQIIRKDVALTCEVICKATSRCEGLEGSSRLEDCIIELGIVELQQLVLAMPVLETMNSNQIQRVQDLMIEGRLTALAAENIARATDLIDPAQAYLAGLLHGIGELHAAVCGTSKERTSFSEIHRENRIQKCAWLGTISSELPGDAHLVSFRDLVKILGSAIQLAKTVERSMLDGNLSVENDLGEGIDWLPSSLKNDTVLLLQGELLELTHCEVLA